MLPTIAGANRPNAPQQWNRSRCGVDLVWHHIIPFNTLRDTWNALVNATHQTQLREAGVSLRQYLLLCSPRSAAVDQWIRGIRSNSLDRPQCDALATLAVWPPWNIVEGPSTRLRTDDFGDRYIDRYTHGLTRLEYQRMLAIETLFRYLKSFIAAAPSAASLRALGDAIDMARPELACEGPIPFRQDMWERDAHGVWKKRRGGIQFVT